MQKRIIISISVFAGVFVLALIVFWVLLPALRPALAPGDVVIDDEGNIVEIDDELLSSPEDSRADGHAGRQTAGELEQSDPQIPLWAPADFDINIYAGGLGKARDLVTAPGGLIVSSMAAGKVVYLPDQDLDGRADERKDLLTGLKNPHGLLEYCPAGGDCKFYVAETHQVMVYDYDKENMVLDNGSKIMDLPDDGGHYTRSLLWINEEGQDKLLVSVGSKCNVCYEEDWRRAKILIANMDGSDLQEYAGGLRNSVFMATNPVTGEVWATDMGRDWLGDDLPPEEVNIIEEGKDYGWPICYGDKVHDTEFDKNQYVQDPCADTVAPHIQMPAHIAPLGLDFVVEEGFGQAYWYDLLVAQHGSWNSTVPVGYKVVRHKLDAEGNYLGTEDFLSGFLQEGEAWGRPVDVLVQPGGLVYVSDDKAGAIYRLTYNGDTVAEVLDQDCQSDDDCELPMDYAIRSDCPYQIECRADKCTVICPDF